MASAMELIAEIPSQRPDTAILRVSGEIDSATSERFREGLVSRIDENTKHVILNLAEVSYINSSGLGALVAAYKRVKACDGTLRLCRVRGSIAAVMSLIRLDKIVAIYDTEEAALASLETS